MQFTNKLAKWRRVFMMWQLGNRPKGDPEADAVVDHREVTILLRAEVSALANLLVQKGIFTAVEYTAQVEVEAEHLDKQYMAKFPGIRSTQEGIDMSLPTANETIIRRGLLRPETR